MSCSSTRTQVQLPPGHMSVLPWSVTLGVSRTLRNKYYRFGPLFDEKRLGQSQGLMAIGAGQMVRWN